MLFSNIIKSSFQQCVAILCYFYRRPIFWVMVYLVEYNRKDIFHEFKNMVGQEFNVRVPTLVIYIISSEGALFLVRFHTWLSNKQLVGTC